jgi:hypothetical protein
VTRGSTGSNGDRAFGLCISQTVISGHFLIDASPVSRASAICDGRDAFLLFD